MEATKTTAPAAAEQTKKKKKKISPYMVFSTVVIVLLAIAFAFPLYWIITGSFKTQVSINATTPEWFPSEWVAPTTPSCSAARRPPCGSSPCRSAATSAPMARMSSGGPARRCPPLSAGWSTRSLWPLLDDFDLRYLRHGGLCAGQKRFIGRGVLFTLIVCAMALPKQVILIPLLREMSSLQLYNTIWAVIFPIVGWPFGIFLMKQFSEGIPGEMLEVPALTAPAS